MEIKRIIGRVGDERGKKAENLLDYSLNTSIANKIAPSWLIGYSPGSEDDDGKKIDGWVETSDVGRIGLQIKSSYNVAKQFRKEFPRIPVVVIRLGDSEEKILNTVLKQIGAVRKKYLRKRG